MPRGLTQAQKDLLATGNFVIANVVQINIDDGINDAQFFTDYWDDLATNIGGTDYTISSTRGLMGISEITEDKQFTIQQIGITFSSIPNDNVKLFLDYDFMNAHVYVYRVLIDPDDNILGFMIVFDGRAEEPVITIGIDENTSNITLSASSHWIDFDAVNCRYNNDQTHQIFYPGDTFFSFADKVVENIKWGTT